MSNFPNQGTAYLEGNPVKRVSLLTDAATPQNSPKVIAGEIREQIMLCDPLTGAALDLQSGGGGGSFTTIAGSPFDNANLATALNGKLGGPGGYDAVNGVPTLTAGVAPASNVPQNYTVTSAGVTATVSALQADIPALRNGDVVVWSPTLTKWVRYAGEGLTIAVAGPLTITDAHSGCLLLCSGTPTITINTGRSANLKFALTGAYTLAGTAAFADLRVSNGNAGLLSAVMWVATDSYQQFGGKL
jgi:hypothetical protein